MGWWIVTTIGVCAASWIVGYRLGMRQARARAERQRELARWRKQREATAWRSYEP